jgi:hypothetical protein
MLRVRKDFGKLLITLTLLMILKYLQAFENYKKRKAL